MLKIYDKNHNAIGHISKYKDLKIESEVATGDKTLSFVYLAKHHNIINEMYVRTKEDEYVVKEVPSTTGAFPQIIAILNLEDLQKDMWQTFSVTDVTIDEAVRTVLAGTGWTIGECDVVKRRNAGMMQVSTLDVIQNLCTAFMCEPVFNTIKKTISFYTRRGEDKGVYFMSGLNLKKLQKKSTSYDYYTRIVPIGQDGLRITDANDGKEYLENYQYSNKILTYIWKDESYTDAKALKEDAELKLEDLSKPTVAYSVDIRDLAAQKKEYSILSYAEGDTVKLIDQETGTMVSQRIKKLVRYPDNPEKNTCEIANTFLTFEELQQKYQAAADIINFTVTSDGRYTGKINVSDILKFEQGIKESDTIGTINGSITSLQGDLANVKLVVGEIKTNYISAEEAELKYATIENLNVVREDVHDLNADYATFKSTTTDEFSAHTARIDTISGDLANYKTVVSDELITAKGWMAEGAIGDAQISSVNANKLKAGTIDTALITIAGSDGRLQIADNTMQISDAARVRVQVGKDASGDYTLAVWDKVGNLIWDALGATDKTIQRKIIRDNVIADDAAIQALKIDFQSFDTALTDQGVVISGTVVQVGDKTLNVALSEQTQSISKAQSTADAASTAATNAQSAADTANIAAKNAQTAADTAKADAATASRDLEEAKQKLEDVTSRVGTTEEEIAAAEEAVNKAQAAADKAIEDAQNAQSTADTAKANAKAAQDVADKAVKDAKAAQDSASSNAATIATHTETLTTHESQIKANEQAISLKVGTQEFVDYKAEVDGEFTSVGNRFTTVDSQLSVLQDTIALTVKTTELDTTLKNYSTTAQMEAAIAVSKNAITQMVSETYTTKAEFKNLKIGARNLLRNSKTLIFADYYFDSGVAKIGSAVIGSAKVG